MQPQRQLQVARAVVQGAGNVRIQVPEEIARMIAYIVDFSEFVSRWVNYVDRQISQIDDTITRVMQGANDIALNSENYSHVIQMVILDISVRAMELRVETDDTMAMIEVNNIERQDVRDQIDSLIVSLNTQAFAMLYQINQL